MTDEKSKHYLINLKFDMCIPLNWYLKTPVSPPVFTFYYIFLL